MPEYLKDLPLELLKIIELVKELSFKLGYKIYLVGGFVRDLILKRKNFDLDISVEGDGINFANALASCLKAKVIRHQRFGTATVVSPEGFKIDIAT
jgi:tRNA nucleotidyltransferase (CCA-adding enzyme)